MLSYTEVVNQIIQEKGVECSTMMKSPCLRFEGDFIAMMFAKEDALIIKVSPSRVDELIETGMGKAFNFTKKRFKEWVLIPIDYEDKYESYIYEALNYAKENK